MLVKKGVRKSARTAFFSMTDFSPEAGQPGIPSEPLRARGSKSISDTLTCDSSHRPLALQHRIIEAIMICVSRDRAFALISIVLLWVAAPAVACVLPGVTLTPAERECCHHMAQHCGQTVMPASHSCCQAPRHNALKQAIFSVPNRRVAIASAIQITFALPVKTRALLAIDLHSPPPDPQFSSISILRI